MYTKGQVISILTLCILFFTFLKKGNPIVFLLALFSNTFVIQMVSLHGCIRCVLLRIFVHISDFSGVVHQKNILNEDFGHLKKNMDPPKRLKIFEKN
jgi:hypothetical protein